MQNKIVGERRGFPIYLQNPTAENIEGVVKQKSYRKIEGNRAMLVDSKTGKELSGEGSVAFVEEQLVDPTQFLKIYLAGVEEMMQLSGTGARVFKILWHKLQKNKDTDRVEFTYYDTKETDPKMIKRTFQKGLKELLEKEFLYMSTSPGLFFFNVNYMFNGDRIVVAKRYRLKQNEELQTELPFDES